jgi:hypothetical protein
MAITVVSRWKGDPQNIRLVREIAPILKKNGAVSVRWGLCHAGANAGESFGAIIFPDWATYGSAMQALSDDAEYKRIYAEATKSFELQERSVIVTEDL